MLREKQQSFDAAEHHKQTILKDEGAFDLLDYSERVGVKSVTHLYSKRIQDFKDAQLEKEQARAKLRSNRRRGHELWMAKKAATKAQEPQDAKAE